MILRSAPPVIGPAIITLFGLDVPVLSLALSLAGMFLARFIAPSPVRKLSRPQEIALTALLAIILLLLVSGRFGGGPMGEGMAVMWGIGLGFSGLLVIETIGTRIMAAMQVLLGGKKHDDTHQS